LWIVQDPSADGEKLSPVRGSWPPRVQWFDHKAMGIRRSDRHLWRRQGHEIRQSPVLGGRLSLAV
ncbi:hypothetical protein A2U01_0098055, partial [Trifolium medium]|nr:hypothetical protein [Trifolium medium]